MFTNKPNKQIYKILAFGDSLTKGYYDVGYSYHPYSTKLNENLIL